MAGWLVRLLGRDASMEDPLLELQRDAQSLRFTVVELEEALRTVKRACERQRSEEEDRIAAALESLVRGIAEEAAAALAQLALQRHVVEAEGTAVRADDVLAAAQELARVFEGRGVRLEGVIGETVPYDPDRHEPRESGNDLACGRPVVVRVPGVSFRGTILRKAGVERA